MARTRETDSDLGERETNPDLRSRWQRFVAAITTMPSRRAVAFYFLLMLAVVGVGAAYGLSAQVLTIMAVTAPIVFQVISSLVKGVVSSVRRRLGWQDSSEEEIVNNGQSTNRGNHPARVLNALVNNQPREALRLLRDVDCTETEGLLAVAAEAVRANRAEVFNHVIGIRELKNHLADNSNRLLIIASHLGRADMVKALLQNREVKNNAATTNNEALREACAAGHLAVVKKLVKCPQVLNNVTFNNNEAVRLAENYGHETVSAHMLGIPAVANFNTPAGTRLNFTQRQSEREINPRRNNLVEFDIVRPRAGSNYGNASPFNALFADLFSTRDIRNGPQGQQGDLRNIAGNRENAMRGLSADQTQALNDLHQIYRKTYTSRGLDSIFMEIRGFLMDAYNKKPVKHKGKALPIAVNAGLSNEVKQLYYAHPVHTAYRFLFLRPNPLMAPNASFAERDLMGGLSARISNDDKINIAHMWLAASDSSKKPPEGYTRDSLKTRFAAILGEIGRAHNWDRNRINAKGKSEEYDDMEGDKPSCGSGIPQRIVQFCTVFLNEKPASRPLSLDIIQTKFKEDLIAEGDNKGSVFNKLKVLKAAEQNEIVQILDDLAYFIITKDDLTTEQNKALAKIQLAPKAITDFIEDCKEHFGANRITQTNQKLNYQGKSFDSYEKVIKEMAANCLTNFVNEIKEKIDSLQKKSKGNAKPGKSDKKGTPILYGAKNAQQKAKADLAKGLKKPTAKKDKKSRSSLSF